jgi:AcrR family transcriptional regulator
MYYFNTFYTYINIGRKAQKKEIIQRTALELFKLYGFKKVSVNDIAVRTVVSPVTVYNHRGSKHDLVREIIKN